MIAQPQPNQSNPCQDWDRDYRQAFLNSANIFSESITYQGREISRIVKQSSKNCQVSLASQHMFIADIDCDNIQKPLERLSAFADRKGGFYKVYKTKNGLRYIRTDIIYPSAHSALQDLEDLGADPNYITLCQFTGHFWARLTPKIEPELALKFYEDIKAGREPDRVNIVVCRHLKDEFHSHDRFNRSAALTKSVLAHHMLARANESRPGLVLA